MEATLARTLQVLIALSGAYLAALWVVLAVWTYRDIESRSRSVVTQVFSTMLSLLFFVPGVLLYMVLRPKETLDMTFQRSLEEEYLLQDLEAKVACPSCSRAISEEFVICPHCRTRLQEECVQCGREVDVRWSLCPYCGHEKGTPASEIRPVLQPVERFIQRGTDADVREIPTVTAIEELEAQAFSQLETTEQPAAIAPLTGRAFDRRKTREMHRSRERNGRSKIVPEPNGHGATRRQESEPDDAEIANVSAGAGDGDR